MFAEVNKFSTYKPVLHSPDNHILGYRRPCIVIQHKLNGQSVALLNSPSVYHKSQSTTRDVFYEDLFFAHAMHGTGAIQVNLLSIKLSYLECYRKGSSTATFYLDRFVLVQISSYIGLFPLTA